jgi:hypothetical protein
MAFITALEVREIRKELKKQFPGWKFSVRGQHYTSVNVDIMKGTADFFADMVVGQHHHQVNQYYIDQSWNKANSKVLNKIKEIIKTAPARAKGGREWYDNSDAQIDYFDTAYYYHIAVGKWDKPYELVA